jgi:hypothetical protein
MSYSPINGGIDRDWSATADRARRGEPSRRRSWSADRTVPAEPDHHQQGGSVAALENDVRDWINAWNDNPKPFRWTKTADEILDSLAKYMSRISGADQ